MSDWPHQIRAHEESVALLESGCPAFCLTSPTGGGKSRMSTNLIRWGLERNKRISLYTNRRMLTDQLIRGFQETDIPFGVRAAGYEEYRNDNPVQICSLATENARVFQKRKNHGDGLSESIKRGMWRLHPSEIDLYDEIHMFKGEMLHRVMTEKREMESQAVGITATPLGISHLFPELVVAGSNSELRKCGAHVPCYVTAPDEPDCSKVRRDKTGEFLIGDIRKSVWTQQIYGSVIKHWKILNSDARPAILFAPGVKESVYFAQEFEKIGVRWAHIDGEEMYLDGKLYKKAKDALKELKGMLEDGTLKGVSNRFVCREGIDIPCLYHGILATPFGSLLSYIQAVGRLLRAHPSLTHVILQDHGGNYWRHGSPNADRDWREIYTLNPAIVASLRAERMREGKEPDPIRCPECGSVRAGGVKCHVCGFQHTKSVRKVIQTDGTLKVMEGPVMKPRQVKLKANTEQLWKAAYHRIKRTGGTFSQARGLFCHEQFYFPPENLPLMPKRDIDWFRKIGEVAPSELHGFGEAVQRKRDKALFD